MTPFFFVPKGININRIYDRVEEEVDEEIENAANDENAEIISWLAEAFDDIVDNRMNDNIIAEFKASIVTRPNITIAELVKEFTSLEKLQKEQRKYVIDLRVEWRVRDEENELRPDDYEHAA